jgi:hypothetical protein
MGQIMVDISGSNREVITLQPGQTMVVRSPDALSSGIVRRVGIDGRQLQGNRMQSVQVNSKLQIGPFANPRAYSIEAVGTKLTYTIDKPSQSFARELGDVWGFTGSLVLNNEMNGRVLRCDDTSNVTITVPGDLAEGFNAGFIKYAAGNVTLSFTSGAVNRNGVTALTTLYQRGSLFVAKQTVAEDTAECMVGGDFA